MQEKEREERLQAKNDKNKTGTYKLVVQAQSCLQVTILWKDNELSYGYKELNVQY